MYEDIPIYGNVSESGGIVSDTTSKKTANERSTVISSEIFSPESGGKRKPRNATVDISVHGNIKLRR